MSDDTPDRAACRHCGDPLVAENDYWAHLIGPGSVLYRCQHTVSYGHNAAHPDVPCEPGGPNPCKCTYAPDLEATDNDRSAT